MRRQFQHGTQNITVTQKYGQSAGSRFKALRQFDGRERNPDGTHRDMTREAWVDMHTGQAYAAGKDWEGSPPNLPSGDAGKEPRTQPPGELYRRNWQLIDWSR